MYVRFFLGIQSVLKSQGVHATAQLIVYGTPAEEGGGGKAMMIEKGAFDEVDICMMCHPCPAEVPIPRCLALAQLTILFHGKCYMMYIRNLYNFRLQI